MQIHVVTATGKSILTLNEEYIPLRINAHWGQEVCALAAFLTTAEEKFLKALSKAVEQAREDELQG